MKILWAWSDQYCSTTKMCTFKVEEGMARIGHPIKTKEAYLLNQNDFIDNDIVLLQRIGGKRENWINETYVDKLREYKSNGKAVVLYHMDDLLCYTIVKSMVSICDGMLVPQEIFPRYFGDVCKKFYKIDTYVDLQDVYPIIPSKDIYDSPHFNMVWASTAGLGYDFICEVMEALSRRNMNCQLFTMCISPPKRLRGAIHLGMLEHKDMVSVIKACDVLLNPISTPKELLYGIPAKDFIDGKSAVKYALAGACFIPIISSKSAPYSKAIINGENGFLLENDPEDWARAIKKLHDLPFNMMMSKKAQDDVKEKYSLEYACNHLLQIFKKAITK